MLVGVVVQPLSQVVEIKMRADWRCEVKKATALRTAVPYAVPGPFVQLKAAYGQRSRSVSPSPPVGKGLCGACLCGVVQIFEVTQCMAQPSCHERLGCREHHLKR